MSTQSSRFYGNEIDRTCNAEVGTKHVGKRSTRVRILRGRKAKKYSAKDGEK